MRSTGLQQQPAATGASAALATSKPQGATQRRLWHRSAWQRRVTCTAAAVSATHPQTDCGDTATAPQQLTLQCAGEWKGLRDWRARGVDKRRGWGETGASAGVAAPGAGAWADVPLAPSLVECAVQILRTACPFGKAALTHRAWAAYYIGHLPLKPHTDNAVLPTVHAATPCELPSVPARPDKPQLVVPKQVCVCAC